MKVTLFDFALPSRLIALRPLAQRENARLLVVRGDGSLEHRKIGDLPTLLACSDVVTINDSRVICARLIGSRPARAPGTPAVTIEVTLHKREAAGRFRAFAQPARRLRPGDHITFAGNLSATVAERNGAEVALDFDLSGPALDAAIAQTGEMPLPPYIAKMRAPDDQDRRDYQTVYADQPGSVAAPTAGLHFTPQLLARMEEAGIGIARTTLHVGAGTFLPVSADDTSDHRMHSEHATLSADTAARLNAVHTAGGRIVAVGTTALRTLESAAGPDGKLYPFSGDTDIFITPGYRFRAVDGLLTNFHLPRSTLFMLVSAFMGLDVMQAAYAEAVRHDYRFYSYGDACLLFRPR
jgi:S-adenosylmethionine:tRNA ribosyltransferase-isomerase